MSKTETQSVALSLALLLRMQRDSASGVVTHNAASRAAAELEWLDAENKALREVLQAVEMDVVFVGSGENVISDATRAKVETVLEQFGAPRVAAKNGGAA